MPDQPTPTATAAPGAPTTPSPAGTVTWQWVDHGPAADAALDAAIAAARGADPLARVTVAVPTPIAGLALRRARATRPGGTIGVQYEQIEQVAAALATPSLAARASRPLTREVHHLFVAEALSRDPGALGRLAGNPETIAAMARAVTRLRDGTAGLDEGPVLDRLASSGDPLRTTLVGVYTTWRDLARGHHDVHDLLVAAADAPAEHVRSATGHLVVHLPASGTAPTGHMLRALAAHVRVHVLLGRTGDAWAERVTARHGARLVGTAVPEPDTPSPGPRPDLQVRVVPDAAEEVRQAARAISAALHDGTPAHRLQVVHATPDPYDSLVHEVFAAAGLPHHGPPQRRVGQTIAGRVLTELLAWQEEDHPRARLLDLLGSAPIRVEGHPPPVARWDRVAKEAGIVGGLRQWDQRLAGHADRCAERATDPTAPQWLQERSQRDHDDAQDLRATALHLAARLDGPATSTWQGWSAWALGLLDDLLGRGRARWPELDREAEGLLRQRLVALAQLDDRTAQVRDGRPRPVDRPDFLRELTRELDAPTGRVGRTGVGVHVTPLDRAGHLDVELTVVLGAVEGALPRRPRGGALLPDEVVAALGDDATRPLRHDVAGSDRVVDAQRLALARVLATSDRAVVCVPRVDRRSQRAARPGPWVVEALRERAGRPVAVEEVVTAHPDLAGLVVGVDSASAGLQGAEQHAGPVEARTAALARAAASGHDLATHPLGDELVNFDRTLQVVTARAADDLTPWDGNLAEVGPDLVAIAERPRSPSRLAAYGACPRSWLLAEALRVHTVDEPRRWLDVDALDRGLLVHRTLQDWVQEQLPDTLPPPPDHAGTLDRLRELFDEHSRALETSGRVGLLALWEQERRRLWRRLERWHRGQQTLTDDGWVPVAVEAPFGMDGSTGLAVPTDHDVTFSFRGQVDRMDRHRDGRVLVLDYKTASPQRYRGNDHDLTLAGTDLQLAVYGLRAQQEAPDAAVAVAYWHVHDRAGWSPPDPIPFDERMQARTHEVLDTMAAGIRGGVFPADPGAESLWPTPGFEHCRYCPFTRICPSHGERQRAARRDLATPEAAVLLPLVESAVLDDGKSS